MKGHYFGFWAPLLTVLWKTPGSLAGLRISPAGSDARKAAQLWIFGSPLDKTVEKGDVRWTGEAQAMPSGNFGSVSEAIPEMGRRALLLSGPGTDFHCRKRGKGFCFLLWGEPGEGGRARDGGGGCFPKREGAVRWGEPGGDFH